MTQSINLFLALPPRPKQYLSSEWLLRLVVFFTTLLILIYGLSYIPLVKAKASLTQLYATRDDLNAQIKMLEQTKMTTVGVNSAISKTKLPQFSLYLEGLAGAIPDGVWLTNIQFSNVDHALNLTGYAINFEIIPLFFKNLAKLPAFPKGKISFLNLSRVDEGKENGSIRFQFGRVADGNI
jgi:Tfp pilus assembly protein PilN